MYRTIRALVSALAFVAGTSSAYPQAAQVNQPGIVQPGETIRGQVLAGSAITLTTTNTTYDLTSVGLSPGTWLCMATVILSGAGTTFPSVVAALNTQSATLPTAPAGGYAQASVSATTGVGGIVTGMSIQQLTANTTLYASVRPQFTGTAPTMYGELRCVRIV